MYVVPVTVPVQRRVVRGAFPRAFAQWFAVADAASDEPRVPALDVAESDAAYTLCFDVPGASKDELKVSVQGRRVSIETVEADAPQREAAPEGEPAPVSRTLYSERRAPRYARTVALPAEVDDAASQACVENGVLTLVLAKRVATGARRIAVS